MAEEGLNLLLFGQPGPQMSLVVQGLRRIARGRLRLAPTLGALDLRLNEGNSDCTVLCLSAEHESDEALLQGLHARVRQARTPVVVVLTRPVGQDSKAAPTLSRFEVVIGSPFEADVIEEAVSLAVVLTPKDDPVEVAPPPSTEAALVPEPTPPAEPRPRPVMVAAPAPSSDPQVDSGDDWEIEVRSWGDSETNAEVAPEAEKPTPGYDPRAVLEAALRDADGVSADGQDPERAVSDTGSRIAVRRWGDPPPEVGPPGQANATSKLAESWPSSLPALEAGDLGAARTWRVLLAHEVAGSTGTLRFENGGMVREILLLQGAPGLAGTTTISDPERRKVSGAVIWDRGSYTFQAAPVMADRFRALGSPLEIVYRAIHEGLSVNQASTHLFAAFKKHVRPTERARDQAELLGQLAGVNKLLDGLGDDTLEQLVTKAAADMEKVLKNLVFCAGMDLVVFSETVGEGHVALQHEFDEAVSRPAPKRTPPGVAAAPQVETATSPPPEADQAEAVEQDASGPTAQEEDDDLSNQVVERLSEIVSQWRDKSAYEVFGLQEGCGQGWVNERYYQLVKAHHPDTYGRALPHVKPLAEMVFQIVQRSYKKLRRVETGESPPGPVGSLADRATDASGLPLEAPEAAVPAAPPAREASQPERAAPVDTGSLSSSSPGGTPVSGASPVVAEQSTAGALGPTPTPPGGQGPQSVTDSSRRIPVLESTTKLRAMARKAGDGFPRSRSSGSVPAVPDEELPPEQLFKRGLNMIKANAFERAVEALEVALESRSTSTVYRAHLSWARYKMDVSTAEIQKALLKELVEDSAAGEISSLYLGKILTDEGDEKSALNYYTRCLMLNRRNIEAQRLVRLYRMRTEQKKEGLFAGLFGRRPTKKKSR